MNRIEEIKERLNKSTSGTWEVFEDRDAKTKGLSKKGIHTEGFTIAFFPDYDFDDNIHFIANAQSDVQYLLSKLEIAEKALNDVLTEFGYNHIEPSERLQEIEYIVLDGIKQIRE